MAKVTSLGFVAVAIAATWCATIDAQSRVYTNADLSRPIRWANAPRPGPAEIALLKARQFPPQISDPELFVSIDRGSRSMHVSGSRHEQSFGWESSGYRDVLDDGWAIWPYGLFHACRSAAIAARVPMDHVYVRGFQCPSTVDRDTARARRARDRR
jgi:hypothetical protein